MNVSHVTGKTFVLGIIGAKNILSDFTYLENDFSYRYFEQ